MLSKPASVTAVVDDENLHPAAQRIIGNVEKALRGKRRAIELCVAALLANGHVLIEDVPGVGKTVLARSLAISIAASFKRVQFTPDLLPGDLIGVQIFRQDAHAFEFRPGPLFSQVVLADEINRASPKTQSALLESMDERRVTVDGENRVLPSPFLVLATQNPLEFEGTYALPESQLDRFLISLELGYPDRPDELDMLASQEHGHPLEELHEVVTTDELLALQDGLASIFVSEAVREYILDLVGATRESAEFQLGGSPRATLALFRIAQAWAFMHAREYVLPDDVKAVATAVLRHRLIPTTYVEERSAIDRMVAKLLQSVPVPGSRA